MTRARTSGEGVHMALEMLYEEGTGCMCSTHRCVQYKFTLHGCKVLRGAVFTEKMCLVLGVVAQPSLGSRQGNNFGTAFRSAATDTEAQIEHDGFDSSIMRVC